MDELYDILNFIELEIVKFKDEFPNHPEMGLKIHKLAEKFNLSDDGINAVINRIPYDVRIDKRIGYDGLIIVFKNKGCDTK